MNKTSIFVPRPNEINAMNPRSQRRQDKHSFKAIGMTGAGRIDSEFGGAVDKIAENRMTKKAQAVFNKMAGMAAVLDKFPKVRKAVLGAGVAAGLAGGVKGVGKLEAQFGHLGAPPNIGKVVTTQASFGHTGVKAQEQVLEHVGRNHGWPKGSVLTAKAGGGDKDTLLVTTPGGRQGMYTGRIWGEKNLGTVMEDYGVNRRKGGWIKHVETTNNPELAGSLQGHARTEMAKAKARQVLGQ